MTNNLWADLKFRLFKTNNPALFYIGICTLVFVLLAVVNIIAFFLGYGSYINVLVDYYLAFPSAPSLWLSRLYTLITYQFLHANFFHLLFNMLWLYWMGQILLDFIKPRQFHFIYLLGGVFGALFFALIYHTIPVFKPSADSATLIGASAAVMAVFAAAATLVPDYTLRLMLIGNIKLKYLFLAYMLLDLIGITSTNAGGSLSHLGGALFGYLYIKFLQNGIELSAIFKRRPKLKVVKNEQVKQRTTVINQKEIDIILDKISKSGYDQLSREEKETLFKASKN